MSHPESTADNRTYPIKRINALKLLAFIAALAGLGLLGWDTAQGCEHHCMWSFTCLLGGALLMFLAWLTELYYAESPYPGH